MNIHRTVDVNVLIVVIILIKMLINAKSVVNKYMDVYNVIMVVIVHYVIG